MQIYLTEVLSKGFHKVGFKIKGGRCQRAAQYLSEVKRYYICIIQDDDLKPTFLKTMHDEYG